MDYENLAKIGGGILAGLTALLLGLHKLNLLRITDNTSAAAASAVTEQFRIMQESMATMKGELDALRASFTNMDRKIHLQQRTITRMEMLLRQFSGLVQDHGIQVPHYMQDELQQLIQDGDAVFVKQPEQSK